MSTSSPWNHYRFSRFSRVCRWLFGSMVVGILMVPPTMVVLLIGFSILDQFPAESTASQDLPRVAAHSQLEQISASSRPVKYVRTGSE